MKSIEELKNIIEQGEGIEVDIFRINIGLPKLTGQATGQAILDFCEVPKSTREIMELPGLKYRKYFRSDI